VILRFPAPFFKNFENCKTFHFLKFSEETYFMVHFKNIFLLRMMCIKTKILKGLYYLKTIFFCSMQN